MKGEMNRNQQRRKNPHPKGKDQLYKERISDSPDGWKPEESPREKPPFVNLGNQELVLTSDECSRKFSMNYEVSTARHQLKSAYKDLSSSEGIFSCVDRREAMLW